MTPYEAEQLATVFFRESSYLDTVVLHVFDDKIDENGQPLLHASMD